MSGVDHQLIRFAALGCQRCEDIVEYAHAAPADEPVVYRLGRAVGCGRVTPAQAISDHENDAANDPAVVYARRNGITIDEVGPGRDGDAEITRREPRAADEESCPKCGGRMWDNRLTKRNPRAPDFKCRDRSCDGVIWPSRTPAKSEESSEWPPLASAPVIPEDAELPF